DRPRRPRHRARRLRARHRQGDRPRDGGHAPAARDRLPAQARRARSGGDGDGGAPHGHRLAVARSDDRAGRRRDLGRAARRPPRHPRVVRQAPREARRHRRLVQGRVEILRAAGRSRDPHHGGDGEDLRRGGRLALQGHRTPHRERARVSGTDQGDRHPGDARGRLREMTVGDVSERDLVARIQQHLQPPPEWVLVGIGDDAAVVEPERNRVEVLTVDALVDGVHFDRAFTPPEAIGHRALAVNLTDLAAMGAAPRLALLSFALPGDLPLLDFERIVGGLAKLARRERVHVVGGNLTRTPGPLTIDVTVSGTVKRRQALTRSGARPGDELYVSGAVGSAAAGLRVIRARQHQGDGLVGAEAEGMLATAYMFPVPRIRLGTLLARNRAATACMDLSDGLADAVSRIAEASDVGAIVDADAVPIDAAARRVLESGDGDADAIAAAIAGGDDYELLFTVRP